MWDPDRDDLVVRIERRLDALRLGEEVRAPEPGDDTVDTLVVRIGNTKLGVLSWPERAVQLRARVALLRDTLGDDWPDWSDKALAATLDEWLRPYLTGATGRADLDRVDVATLLRHQLPWPFGAELDELAPPAWTLPGGRTVAIDYTGERPTASVRVQDVFGVKEHPTIARGRVPITLRCCPPPTARSR